MLELLVQQSHSGDARDMLAFEHLQVVFSKDSACTSLKNLWFWVFRELA